MVCIVIQFSKLKYKNVWVQRCIYLFGGCFLFLNSNTITIQQVFKSTFYRTTSWYFLFSFYVLRFIQYNNFFFPFRSSLSLSGNFIYLSLSSPSFTRLSSNRQRSMSFGDGRGEAKRQWSHLSCGFAASLMATVVALDLRLSLLGEWLFWV